MARGIFSGSGIVTGAKQLMQNSKNTIFNGILIVLTISGESTFSALAFKCPCGYPQNVYYGGAFLFIPALSLFLIGILVNNSTWKLVHGCFYRHLSTRHGFRRSIYYWVLIFSQASVAPLAWMFVGFLNGEYYSCFRAGDAEACQMEHSSNSSAIKSKLASELGETVALRITHGGLVDPNCVCNLPDLEKHRFQASSQIIAWYILLFATLITLLVHMISACTDRFTFRQNYFFNLYRRIEDEQFEEVAKKRATELALQNSKAFFDKENRTKLDWDRISVVPLNDFPHFLTPKKLAERADPYFSPLHRWANPNCKHQSLKLQSDVMLVPTAESEEEDDVIKNSQVKIL